MSDKADLTGREGAGDIARLLSYVLLLALSGGLFLEAWSIPTSRFEVLGAGAFPMLVHGTLILLLLTAIVGSLRKIPAEAYGRFAGEFGHWVRTRRLVLALFACLGVYLAVMPMIGYPLATLVFLLVLQLLFAPKTRRAVALAVILSLVFSFGLNWLLAEVFNVFLPRGR